MPIVWNTSMEDQHTRVFGNHFVLKANQKKMFTDDIAGWLAVHRKDLGFMVLGPEFDDPEYATTEAGIKTLAEVKEEGVKNRIDHLRRIIYNNTVSLKKDLEAANIKIDPRSLASDGEIKAMEELVKYQRKEEDEAKLRADKFKALEDQLNKTEV